MRDITRSVRDPSPDSGRTRRRDRRPVERRSKVAVVAALLVSASCEAGAAPAIVIPDGCNPIAAEWDCLLPYPSDVFLENDASMPSGHRVVFSDASVSISRMGVVDLSRAHPADGYPLGTQILAVFPGGLDASALVPHGADVARSTSAASPTAVVAADTGERVLHFAETDPIATTDARRALVIRPLVALRERTRYVVAIRGLSDRAGAPVEPPAGFAAIRDGLAGAHPILGALAARYEAEIFPVLERAGIGRAELQLAWDFTTESEEHVTRDMLEVRDDVRARVTSTPPAVAVTSMMDDVDAHVGRRIEATVRVPLYVDSAEPGARLAYDPGGHVVASGEADVPVVIVIPRSVTTRAAGSAPARLLQYGHGFFGDRTEADSDWLRAFADEYGFVVVAADWWGMSEPDLDVVVAMALEDAESTFAFTDRVHQAMANFIAIAAAAQGPIAALPELEFVGAPAYDPSHLYYYGISNGHILGGTYNALSPHTERAVLGSGGADFSLIMFRSYDFADLLTLVRARVRDPLDVQKFGAMSQLVMERIDPMTYARHLLTDPYPGAPIDRRFLLQIGVDDAEVPNLASELHARVAGIPLLHPSPREVPALMAVDAPTDGSAMATFDFGVAPPAEEPIPPTTNNEVHEGVRRLVAAQRQVDAFLRPSGTIASYCDGVCDPE